MTRERRDAVRDSTAGGADSRRAGAARLEELDQSRAGDRRARRREQHASRSARQRRHALHGRGARAARVLGSLGSRRRHDLRSSDEAVRFRPSRRTSSAATPARRSAFSRASSRSVAAASGSTATRGCGSARSRTCSMRCGRSASRRGASGATAVLPSSSRRRASRAGTARIAGEISSQFASAVLLVAPYARHDVLLDIAGDLVSAPFVDMTLALMRRFGVESTRHGTGIAVASGPALPGRRVGDRARRHHRVVLPRRRRVAGRGGDGETESAASRCRATSGFWTCSLDGRGGASRARPRDRSRRHATGLRSRLPLDLRYVPHRGRARSVRLLAEPHPRHRAYAAPGDRPRRRGGARAPATRRARRGIGRRARDSSLPPFTAARSRRTEIIGWR